MPIRGSIANSLKSFGGDRVGRDIPEVKTGYIDYIMVAGGGGGGYNGGGGGGGGGFITGSGYPVSSGTTLSIGIGGGGGAGNGGGSSTLSGPGTPSLTAIGGGDGGDGDAGPGNPGGNGGSGGGGGRNTPAPSTTSYGLGTPGQGNRGGRGGNPPNGAAGGGGGIGGGGQDGSAQPQYDRDDPRNGGDGRSVNDVGWGIDPKSYLNSFGISGGTPSGTWENYIMSAGGGNGIYRGAGNPGADRSGNGGSSRSWTGYPNTGGQGGAAPGTPVQGNNATQYTGSGGGGGAANPGGGVGTGGGSGSGGTILIKYDAYFANASSISGDVLYVNQSGYRIFHWLGSGSITF